ncbi:hypothetical protein YC2023_000004 [Brassica napus]
MLSQNIRVGFVNGMWSSLKKFESQNSSSTAAAILRYSASAVDLETVSCFLERQLMSEEPKKIQYPDVERLVSRHEPQSASAKTCN